DAPATARSRSCRSAADRTPTRSATARRCSVPRYRCPADGPTRTRRPRTSGGHAV
ncbi:MAG: hypothetical protein AVDCRST_MAG66-3555, partial [uncultured Pseudonocardia sp.]